MSRSKIVRVSLAVLGSVTLLLGILAVTLVPNILNNVVSKRQHLGFDVVNGTKQYNELTKSWIKPPYHLQIQMWMYNILNEQDVLRGEKPKVEEIGPFTFKEVQEKIVHNFTRNDTRVVYRNNHVYLFNRTASCAKCSLDRKVTIPNVLFQKLVDFAEMGFMYKLAIEAALVAVQRETPFMTVTVGEALFEGYQDPLLSKVCSTPIISALCKGAAIPERIGFFYGQNNSYDGTYEISSGLNEPWNLAKVHSWNNMTILPETYWDNKQARMINGSDGQLFPPLLESGKPLTLFAAPVCRSVWMEYRSFTVFQGVPAYRYGVPASMYDPSRPENAGFCNKNNTPTYFNTSLQIPGCLPAGLLDFGRCQPGQPRVYLSQAHFFNSPKEVHDSIIGIAPPSADHDDTVVDIEPTSGAPINAKRVMQINVGMKKGNLGVLANTSNLIMPVLWLNETAVFDEATREQLKNELVATKHWTFVLGLVFMFLGVCSWMALIGMMIVHSCIKSGSEDTENLINDEEREEGQYNEIGDDIQ